MRGRRKAECDIRRASGTSRRGHHPKTRATQQAETERSPAQSKNPNPPPSRHINAVSVKTRMQTESILMCTMRCGASSFTSVVRRCESCVSADNAQARNSKTASIIYKIHDIIRLPPMVWSVFHFVPGGITCVQQKKP